jgi:hypothetical protein
VKKGACAPLRLRSMESFPATGMTRMVVMVGVWWEVSKLSSCYVEVWAESVWNLLDFQIRAIRQWIRLVEAS